MTKMGRKVKTKIITNEEVEKERATIFKLIYYWVYAYSTVHMKLHTNMFVCLALCINLLGSHGFFIRQSYDEVREFEIIIYNTVISNKIILKYLIINIYINMVFDHFFTCTIFRNYNIFLQYI